MLRPTGYRVFKFIDTRQYVCVSVCVCMFACTYVQITAHPSF